MAVEPFEPDQLHPVEAYTHLYRVGFWWKQEPPSESWGVEVWDVRAEDVHEVIEWAEAKAEEKAMTYTLFARVEDGQAPGEDLLVLIAGVEPTRYPPFSDGFSRRHPLRGRQPDSGRS